MGRVNWGGLSAGAAFIAATLWFWSATVSIPKPGRFPIVVGKPDATMMLDEPLDGKFGGIGTSKELQDWSSNVWEALALQSWLSALAAISAAIAAIFAGVAELLRSEVAILSGLDARLAALAAFFRVCTRQR